MNHLDVNSCHKSGLKTNMEVRVEDDTELNVLELHNCPLFLEKTTKLLNLEWPRSDTARKHNLEKSCASLPISLILTADNNGETTVIGHSRICSVPGDKNAVLIESVVVDKSIRGKGYGKKMMHETELFAKRKGYLAAYLSTHDKQSFYEHIGYFYCSPVFNMGANSGLLTEDMVKKLFGTTLDGECKTIGCGQSLKADKCCKTENNCAMTPADCDVSARQTYEVKQTDCKTTVSVAVPPAPPLPPPTNRSCCPNPLKVSWMKKEL